MRLLVVTARYPTPDRPSAGPFIRDRLADPEIRATVVAPRNYRGWRWVRVTRMAWQALTISGQFDGVEAHFVLSSGPIGLLAARLRGLPLVVYAHGSDVRETAQRSPVHRWLAGLVLRSADAVVTNSAETADHVAGLGGKAITVPPGIDLARFRPTPRPRERRVLYLGGNVDYKGVDIARRLADTLVGPGIREIDAGDMPALIARHDVVLVPSRREAFGLVAAEAAASGRWVIAGAVGGLRDLVLDGVSGTLVADGDYESALTRVPNYDPIAVAETAGRFSLERSWAGMAGIWAQVLRDHGPGPRSRAPRR